VNADGLDEIVAETAGDYFGKMGALFNLPRSATARAHRCNRHGLTMKQFRAGLGPAGGVRGLITGTSEVTAQR
jgi:putative ABC transport system ATP-binding protein